ncbi:hemagluttinin domain-containing protein [Burkholderia lata]|uniref:Hemagluttinin domain-containing protein n=1 Tax=Burkholderia lata (strain ATCC 17760 / DSM 23089 / LMG 22485 / NCIMB 9086 / R18194 / 383) TaxID=482957 RepID=A0A6P2S171_BURL3|nr:hemagluttinin domain-containing protein [Burkholderia lata]
MAIGPNAVANNAGDVALGNGSVTAAANPTANGTIGGVAYSYAGTNPTSVVSVGAAGAERQVTNVAAGRVTATSTDAINGSQLFATNTAINTLSTSTSTGISTVQSGVNSLSTGLNTTNSTVASLSTGLGAGASAISSLSTSTNNLGGSTAGALGGGATYNPATGTISAPSYTTYNANGTTSTANNVGSAIDNINSQGIRYFHANSTAADSQALGTNSVAIGPNAVANNAGDVALGNGSVTAAANPTASETIGGTSYTVAGTNPTSVVSVGAAGAERQVTNVAAGRVTATSTDAINGSQLFATNTAINTLSTGLSTTNSTVASLSTGLGAGASAISSLSTSTNNLGGSTAGALGGGATYNPATGTISAPSYTTYNANGTTSTANNVGSAIDNINSQGIRYFHANSTAPDSQALGANSVAIGPNAVANNAGDVALGNGSVTAAANPTANGTIGGVAYSYAGTNPTSVVSVGAAGAERQVTNVAAGRVTATSTDAINGSQLFATNTAVNTLSTGLSTTNSTVASLSTSTSTAIQAARTHYYSVNDNGTQQANYNNDGATGINALAMGTSATAAGASSVAVGDGANANSNGAVAIGQSAMATGGMAVSIGVANTASGDGAVAIGDPNVATGTGAVALGANNTATGNGALAIGNANSATGAGSIALGNTSTAGAAGSLAFGSNAIANNVNDVALGSGSVTSTANPTSNVAIGGVTYAFAGNSPTSVVSVGAPGAERQITNVAAGRISATSTDAVNGSQLNATNMAVNSLSTSTSNSITSLSTGLNTTNSTVASLSTSTATGFTSLSTGLNSTNATVASLSTGVTNINNQLSALSTTINNNTIRAQGAQGIAADLNGTGNDTPKVTAGSNSVAIGANSNDGGRSNVVSVGSDTQQRQITNVAAGTQGTDAVNVNQLNAVSTSLSTSMTNLGNQISQTQQQIQQTDQMAREGIAATAAIASIPHMDRDSNFAMGLGTATFGGQKAIAVGMQARITENLKATLNGGFSGNQRVVGAGMLYQWK